MLSAGILIAYGAGIILNWSNLAFLGCSLAVPFIISMILIPETPRWYVSRNKEEHARKALQWLRGKQADVEPELKGILKTHHEAERHASSNGMAQLMKKCNLKPLSISLGLMLFQQLSGINAVIFYAVDIFKGSGSTIDSNISSMLIGVVNFAATFIATCVIDRFGRKVGCFCGSMSPTQATHVWGCICISAAAVHFIGRHDHHTGRARRLFLCQGSGHQSGAVRLDTAGQPDDVRAVLLAGLRTDSVADDGRDSAGEDSRQCCVRGDRLQLVDYVHCDENVRQYCQ